MTKVELTHDWSANMWDWPMQHADGVVKVHNSKELFEVGLEVQQYTPNERDTVLLVLSINLIYAMCLLFILLLLIFNC